MRTRKYIPKKGMALMLALLMCISASQLAAFTGPKGGNVSVTTTVTDVSGNPPAIPEDAAVSTETTQSTDPSTGETTKTVITDTTWGSTEEKTGDYVPEPTATPTETQQDGQIITTETQVETKTDVKTEVEGQQHREDTEVTNQNGARLEDSFTLEGSQIHDLFAMTPHLFRIGRAGAQRLQDTQRLRDTASCILNVYRAV